MAIPKHKATKQGRFVTLQSKRVIFIPAGYKRKWADVRDEVQAGKRGEPKVKREFDIPGATKEQMRGMSKDDVTRHLKERGWKGPKVKYAPKAVDRAGWFESESVDLGGGQQAHLVGRAGIDMYAQYGPRGGGKGSAKTAPLKRIPTPEEFKAAVRLAQAKDAGWGLGAEGRRGRETKPVVLGGGSKGWLRIGPEGRVSAFTQFEGGYPQEDSRPLDGLPSVEDFKAMYSTE